MRQSIFIFDVDGVLNDLQTYKPDKRIITHIAELLDGGGSVAINTGRGYAWIEENVVRPIREQLKSQDSMACFFVAAEMGGLGVEFKDGAENRIKSAFSLSPEQIATVRATFEAHPEYAEELHWYEKESMATLDKNGAIPIEDFRPSQQGLTAILKEVFKDQHVLVANSNDAIDVHAPEAGKWAGAELIHEWLRRSTDIKHDHFVCFGDSVVDFEMARFFAEQSHDTVFVYTGLSFEGDNPYPNLEIVKTESPYNEGANQYLEDIKEL
jgi:hydroxymethylpyrimidine pyrophosphatase-like HAD family hydrolase